MYQAMKRRLKVLKEKEFLTEEKLDLVKKIASDICRLDVWNFSELVDNALQFHPEEFEIILEYHEFFYHMCKGVYDNKVLATQLNSDLV